jgi:hypothetical protein
MKKAIGFAGLFFLLMACSSEPPKPQTPSLTPEAANQALHYNPKAETWLAHSKKQDPSCVYAIDIPDQSNHPLELEFSHILKCNGRPAPLELDASVVFEYDKDAQHWVITRFSD